MNASGHCASSHGQFIVIVACHPVCLWTSGAGTTSSHVAILTQKAKNTKRNNTKKHTNGPNLHGRDSSGRYVCHQLTSWHHPSSAVDGIWQNAPQVSVQSLKLSWGGLSDLLLLSTKFSAAAKENTAAYWQKLLGAWNTHSCLFDCPPSCLRDYISKTSVVYVRLQFTVHSLTALMLSWTVHLLTSLKCTDCCRSPNCGGKCDATNSIILAWYRHSRLNENPALT